MNRRDRLAIAGLSILLVVVAAVMLATASQPTAQPAASEGLSSASPQPSSDLSVTYREAVVSHPSSINPLTAATQADRDLVALLFRGLVRAGPDGSIAPDLAASWSVSGDGRTYTFEMVPDARWDDGQPVTAADIVFTVDLAQDPSYDGPLGSSWQGIKAATAGTYSVTFTLPTPVAGFLRQAELPILPEHLLGEADVTALATADYSSKPVGDGPFRITEIDGTHALLTRTQIAYPAQSAPPSGSGSAAGLTPSVSAITSAPGSSIRNIYLLFYDDQSSAIAAFRNGQADGVGGLVPDGASAAASRAGSRLERYDQASLFSIVLNQRGSHPEFANLTLRKALRAGIDRESIVSAVLFGRGSVADAPLPSWSSWFDRSALAPVSYDPSSAAAGLRSAGWTRNDSGWTAAGAKAVYSMKLLAPDEFTNPVAYRAAQRIVADWTTLGLGVTLVTAGAGDYADKLANGDFDAAVVDYQLGLDPDVSPLLLSSQVAPDGSNLSGVADKTLDGLLGAVRITVDPNARRAAVSALEKYVSSNVLMLPICFADYEFVVSGRVRGLSTNELADPSGRYWDVLDWRLASDG